MILTLILGILAGAGAPYAERHVKAMLEGVLLEDSPLTETELRMLTFATCLLVAAVAALLFASNSAVALALGAAIGVFAPRVVDTLQGRRNPDYDS